MEEGDQIIDVEAQTGKLNHSQTPATAVFKKTKLPITLKFENVVYKIKPKKEGSLLLLLFKKNRKSAEEKIILKGISGMVKPGEMVAMLGPSGSGKTTLITLLGGRLSDGSISGKITYNGKPFSNAMKRNTGFVTQDDVLHPHLTVTETLVFTALLRLPNTLTKDDKIKQAETVITQLGLSKCKNSIIGGPLLRGISGGERKRVSIGQEMLINPSLLLLDEPTSGLDSTTAQRIIEKLWELSTVGKTIVMTIHQPSSRLFYMFHKVMLLSEGNVLYFGNGAAALDYFATIGYAPSLAINPSDFLLDLANGLTSHDSEEDQATVKQNLISAFKSNLSDKLNAEIQETDNQQFEDGIEDKNYGDWPTTWWQQFIVLLKRGIKERRYQNFSGLKIFQVLAISILCGLIWWQSDISHLQDQLGLLFFVVSFWNFFPMAQAIFTFPPERKILAKERSSGMYRLSSYFVSRTVGDLPMELVLPTAFVTIVYWMAGLKPTFLNFVMTLFATLFNVLAAQGLGLALGALVMDQRSATTLGSVIMLTYNLTGGYFVQHVPAFIAWIKYVSIALYSYKLLLGSQYKPSDTYPCTSSSISSNVRDDCLVGDYLPIKKVGLDGYVISAIALALMILCYRLIAYIALMRIGVTKS